MGGGMPRRTRRHLVAGKKDLTEASGEMPQERGERKNARVAFSQLSNYSDVPEEERRRGK